MTDHFTACLAADEATVTSILTSPPFNHVYVETFGTYGANLIFNTYTHGETVGAIGVFADGGNKVVIHSQTP